MTPTNGLFGWGWDVQRNLRDISDGTSHTLAMGEFVQKDAKAPAEDGNNYADWPGNCRPWIFGGDGSCGNYSSKVVYKWGINADVGRDTGTGYNHLPFGSHHPGGASFLVVDGSVAFLGEDVELNTYKYLMTINGSEVFDRRSNRGMRRGHVYHAFRRTVRADVALDGKDGAGGHDRLGFQLESRRLQRLRRDGLSRRGDADRTRRSARPTA